MNKIKIHNRHHILSVAAEKYRFEADLRTGLVTLSTAAGNHLLDFPLSVRMTLADGAIFLPPPLRAEINDCTVTFRAVKPGQLLAGQEFIFEFSPDFFSAFYRGQVRTGKKLIPTNVAYFRDPELGFRMTHLKEGFCIPDRADSDINYRDVFPSASLNGLASPALLNIALVFHYGILGIGLLEFSNATRFGLLNPFGPFGDPFLGLHVEALGKNITYCGGETYTGPKVAFTFPSGSWESITCFRDLLQRQGQVAETSLANKPDWWQRPTYCTYGDQIMHLQPALYTDKYWSAPGYTEKWVKQFVLKAEKRLAYRNFSVIIDAFWQKAWDPDPVGDPVRFPHMRKLVDWLHGRGHKVLLWYAPLICGENKGVGRIARAHGLKTCFKGFLNTSYLDYSSPQAGPYLREICERLFGCGKTGLNADGVKMDFLMGIPPTEEDVRYENPENGMGFKSARRFLELFSAAAAAVKPDVLLNYSASDPRMAHLFGANRLHDTKVTPLERERRARASVLACPNLMIDSDGAVMMSDWVEHTYIAAAIYSTPSLYYVDRFNDGQQLPLAQMNTLGKLFAMCERKEWGIPEFVDYGAWRLRKPDGTVVGESYAGKLCWLKTAPDKINVLGFHDQSMEIDLHGVKVKVKSVHPTPKGLKIKKDKVRAEWKGGVLYSLVLA